MGKHYCQKLSICSRVVLLGLIEFLTKKLYWMPSSIVLLLKYSTTAPITSITNDSGLQKWIKQLKDWGTTHCILKVIKSRLLLLTPLERCVFSC